METVVLSYESEDPYRIADPSTADDALTLAIPKELADRARAVQKEWDAVQEALEAAVDTAAKNRRG